MEKINCRAIAVERLFAGYSDSLSRLDEFSAQELSERLGMISAWERLKIAYAARRGLRELRDYYSLDKALLPENILSLADAGLFRVARKECLIVFLEWLRELHADNEKGRQEWVSGLAAAASRLGSADNSFLRSFFSLSNQRVFITFCGDTLTLSAAEREWGRIRAEFTECIPEKLPAMPLPGYAVSAEAAVGEDGRLAFSLLIDTCFKKDSDFIDRLLSEDGWQRLEFTCGGIVTDITCVDYAARMRGCGMPRADMVENACRALVNKAMLLGDDGLNPSERAVLPAVILAGGMRTLREGDVPEWQGEEMILDALSNRYAVEKLIGSVRESGCAALAACLENAAQASYDSDEDGALRMAKLFSELLDRCIADGTARPLLHRLCRELERASSLNTGTTARMNAERTALECVENSVAPVMERLGFSGSFPDFRRRGDGKLEFISFILDSNGDCANRGVLSFTASMAAGETEADRFGKDGLSGIGFDDATALDCLAEAFGPSHYAELCGEEDASGAEIDIDLYGGEPAVVRDESAILSEYIDIAERQFTSGKIPPAYRRERVGFPGRLSAFPRSLVRYLPAAVVAAVIVLAYGLVLRSRGAEPDVGRLFAAALIAGAAADILCGTVRCAICSLRLWRY